MVKMNSKIKARSNIFNAYLAKMKISKSGFRIEFKEPFKIALGVRTGTDCVMVEIEEGGKVGYGEASLPPYLEYSSEQIMIAVEKFSTSLDKKISIENALEILHKDSNIPNPAKAAIDEALWDLSARIKGVKLRSLFGNNADVIGPCTFTLGLDTPEQMASKAMRIPLGFLLKAKLGGEEDIACLEAIRSVYQGPMGVDVNQAWKERKQAIQMAELVDEFDLEFLEQPCPKEELDLLAEISAITSCPVIADESCQTIDDISKLKNRCDGINIKLIKCGGISPALKMIKSARENGLMILLGCMSETSCGIAAAAQLGELCDWVDLDGPLLISNDPFEGLNYERGTIILPTSPGLGITKVL